MRQPPSQEVDDNEAICRYAISLNPNDAALHFQLAVLLCQQNQPLEAMESFSQAIKCDPAFAAAYDARGSLRGDLKIFDQAIADHQRAIELVPGNIEFHLAMVRTLQAAGDYSEADRCCRRALELDPASAGVWEALGRVLQTIGNFEEAARCFRRAMEIRPSGAVGVQLSRLLRQTEATDEQKIIDLLKMPDLPAADRIAAGFALGNIFDETGRFDEAFTAYSTANALFKNRSAQQGLRFDADDLHRIVDHLIDTFTPQHFRDRSDFGQKSELPVFIVGMPRSGTSLVEQIAATHSKVFGAGELQDIGLIHARLTAMDPNDSPRHWHRHLARVHLARLALIAPNAARIIDKMPANILHLGLIATLFPGVRVIFCERDPRDTCLSCYFQLFSKHHQLFSYDLADCARQFLEQQRLTDHWKQVLPIQMLSVRYEDLVADPENQSRRLIDFLGLDWEPNCLEYHRTQRSVLTLSAWQVRQPIYTRSLERWKHYETHLGPLLDALSGR